MRIHVEVPELLPDLCEFLEGRGFAAVKRSHDELEVVLPEAPNSFEVTTMLLADLALWRAKRPWAPATLDPGSAD